MTRDEALEELKVRISNKDVLRHSLAVEAIMKEFARYYNADADIWGMAGLLHDIDYEKTVNKPSLHGIVGADILENLDIDEAIVYSIRAHNDFNDIPRKRKMDKMLVLAGYISDLIIRCALMLPNKKISEVSVEFVLKKINEKEFEEIINRDKIKYLEELGFTVEKFIDIALKVIQGVSQEFAL
ncbi:MAG: HDIG domain-containing metalloprotein [Ruminiclostridium sp.]